MRCHLWLLSWLFIDVRWLSLATIVVVVVWVIDPASRSGIVRLLG